MRSAVILVACVAAFAAPASAAIKLVTVTGLVRSGYDTTGVFGSAGTTLDGASFKATYRYDTSLGARAGTPGVSDELYGGSAYFGGGIPTPVTDSSLTINGVRLHIPAARQGSLQVKPDYVGYIAFDQTSMGTSITTILMQTGGNVPNAGAIEADIPLQSLLNDTSNFYFQSYDFDTGITSYFANAVLGDRTGSTISVTNAVPEPTAWAMMISGFSLVGAASRRRRVSLAA